MREFEERDAPRWLKLGLSVGSGLLFATGFLEASYRRFVERRLREEFGFQGSPVHVSVRLREKRAGRPSGRVSRR